MNIIQRTIKRLFRIQDKSEEEAARRYERLNEIVGLGIGRVYGTYEIAKWKCEILNPEKHLRCNARSELRTDIGEARMDLLKHFHAEHRDHRQSNFWIYEEIKILTEDGVIHG